MRELKNRKTGFAFYILLASLSVLVGCQNPFTLRHLAASSSASEGEADESSIEGPAEQAIHKVFVSGAAFTLAWDDSAGVGQFTVYARPHASAEWKAIATKVESSSFVVTTSHLPYGEYDFAVSSVAEDGTESELHTSMDKNADPATGWYLEWVE